MSWVPATSYMRDASDLSWDDINVRYHYATIYEPSRRRHWWQLWRSKHDRVIWSGLLGGSRK